MSVEGKHADWVFSFRGHRINKMNNTAWQRARREANSPQVRIHDLRHGASEEDRAALLGHACKSMTGHYASADIGRLITVANRVLDRIGTRTLLRVANGLTCG